jgi:hypothetical protein
MKAGRSLSEIALEIERQTKTKRDFKADTRALSLFSPEPNLSQMTLGNFDPFTVTDTAHEQISEKMGIPKKYYDRMRTQAPFLLDQNVNHWLHSTQETRLIRTLDGKARAFLSDRYAIRDNFDVAQIALETLQKHACQVVSCELTERRMYIKAITERISGEVTKGDVVQTGIVISNSEVGYGAINVEPLIYRLVCLNGMIVPDRAFRRHHIGKGSEGTIEGATEYYLNDTRKADELAFWMKVRDVINGTFNQDLFNVVVEKMRVASGQVIDKPIEVMEIMAEKFSFSDVEKEGILSQLIKGGNPTQYGLLNAVTAFSSQVADYDRATDLERIGGMILEMPKAAFSVN